MAYINQKKYYTNDGVNPTDANWGSYQYVSLEDIVNNFELMYAGNHSLVNNESRYKILFHAKRGIQELNYDAFNNIKALELTVYDDLKFILPPDFVNWVRLSMYKDGWIRPLTENIQVNSATSYQQSSSTPDFNGNDVIIEQSTLDTERLNGQQNSIYLNKNNADDQIPMDTQANWYADYTIGARYGLNTETGNINPTFRLDKTAGVINFDSTMANQNCILEYISDGMENGDDSKVQLNKLFEDYIYAYIEYAILNSKFNVQEYIINRARKRKTALLRNAKIRLSNIHPGRLLMNLRGENKWIK
tara:strand:- start:5939 stop:6850 length:912 start_codon:yes stop_codon:yes gene_type:complete